MKEEVVSQAAEQLGRLVGVFLGVSLGVFLGIVLGGVVLGFMAKTYVENKIDAASQQLKAGAAKLKEAENDIIMNMKKGKI
jgi:hypothetical protein